MVLKNTYFFFFFMILQFSRSLSTDTAGQLDVLGHDGHTLGMDCAQVGILKQANEVRLSCFLQGSDGSTLETEVRLEVLSNLTHQALEGQLANQELSGLLVAADLTKSNSARPEPVWLLDTTTGRNILAGSLGGDGLAGSLASSGLTCSLLGAGHDDKELRKLHNKKKNRMMLFS